MIPESRKFPPQKGSENPTKEQPQIVSTKNNKGSFETEQAGAKIAIDIEGSFGPGRAAEIKFLRSLEATSTKQPRTWSGGRRIVLPAAFVPSRLP